MVERRSRSAVGTRGCDQVVQDVNGFLHGWTGYFRYGNSAREFDKLNHDAVDRIARLVAKRQLCVSDAHQGVAQRDRLGARLPLAAVHRALFQGHARSLRPLQQPMIATAIRQIFAADDGQQARERSKEVVGRLHTPAPRSPAGSKTQPKTCSASPRSQESTGPSSDPSTRCSRQQGDRPAL